MSGIGGVLELRMRRSWRVFLAIAVPALAVLMVGGSVAILTARSAPGLGGYLGVLFIWAILGGLCVVPGIVVLARLARGAPDVRLDVRGVVWGDDRSRDLAIDWSEVESVASKVQQTQYLTDRLFVIRVRGGATPARPQTAYGRMMAVANRMTSGSRFAISTMAADHSWDEIRATIEARTGRPIVEA